MKRFASGLLIATAVALGATTAHGSAAAPAHHMLGKVPHHGSAHRIAKAVTSSGFNCGVSCTLYETAINKYFTDVAADSGTATNVYSIANQYCQGIALLSTSCGVGDTHIAYDSTFGGSYVDGRVFPANACNDTVTINLVQYGDKYCLTDAQLQTEINRAIVANSWPTDSTRIFFIFTPANVGICAFPGNASQSNECSTNVFCAYHGATPSKIIYAVVPDDAQIPDGGCDSGLPATEPVGSGADATLSSVSHEHNEAITDPYNGWWAADGSENGDLCAYNFGDPLGTTPTLQQYNQVINGTDYWLQQEYSNADGGCLQQPGATVWPVESGNGSGPLLYRGGSVMTTNTVYAIYWVPVKPANTVLPAIRGTAKVGRKLTATNGTWSAGTKFTYRWLRCSSAGTSCKPIGRATRSSYTLVAADARHRLEVRVTGTNIVGSTVATSAPTATVKS